MQSYLQWKREDNKKKLRRTVVSEFFKFISLGFILLVFCLILKAI